MKIAYPAFAPDHSNPAKNKKLIGNYLISHFEKAGAEVQIFTSNEKFLTKYFLKVKKAYYQYFLRKNHLRHREPKLLKEMAHQISSEINKSDADVVFAFGTLPVAFLEVNKPIYILTDATFRNLQGFYSEYTNLSEPTIRSSEQIERLAFDKSEKIFFSSAWAANSALNDYGIQKEKIEIIPLGANLDNVPNIEDIDKTFDPRSLNQINLLSFGKNWLRKGHDRAVEVLDGLIKKGVNAHLTIIGSPIPENWDKYDYFLRSKIVVYHSLHKEIPNELDLLESILKKTHFLLLLSRAETYGHVICEANAYGIPVIANNIGGIPSAIRNGINGFLVEENELPDKPIKIISELFNQKELYKQLSLNSKIEYEEWLNWDNAVRLILEKIHK